MSDAQRYLERAAQAELLAHQMTDTEQRDQLRGIAGDWRLLAERVKALEARHADSAATVIGFGSEREGVLEPDCGTSGEAGEPRRPENQAGAGGRRIGSAGPTGII
jgi:hypothetical protein